MIVDVTQIKEQIGATTDMGDVDDQLLGRKIAAAQDHIERLLGFKIEERYGAGKPEGEVPASLCEAVCQLVANWYENREAVNVGNIVNEMPFSVADIVREYRDYTFG